MKINRSGITRIVFIFKHIVIKIPNPRHSWHHFIQGILANINEGQTWAWNSGQYESGKSHLLCPVIWYSNTGFLLIMKRADVNRHTIELDGNEDGENYREFRQIYYKDWINAGFGGDDKPDNYGYINNQLVKIDYG